MSVVSHAEQLVEKPLTTMYLQTYCPIFELALSGSLRYTKTLLFMYVGWSEEGCLGQRSASARL